MARPRKDEGRETRQDILDRSLDLFAEHGFYGTSMRDIAKAVGVRESALYHYFPGKADILTELLKTLGPGKVNVFIEMDFGALIDAFGGEEMVRRLVETILAMWSTPEERKIFRVMFSEGPRLADEGIANPVTFLARVREAIARIYVALRQKQLVRDLEPAAAAQAFMGPMVLMRFTYLSQPSKDPDWSVLRVEGERHVAFWWNAVKAEPAEAQGKKNRTTVQKQKGGR